MKANEFRIFIPDNRFIWSANKIVYSTFAICIAVAMGFYHFEDHHPVGNLLIEIAIIFLFAGVAVSIVNYSFVRKTLEGRIGDTLKLESDRIVAGDVTYQLEDLLKIDFNAGDYLGRRELPSRGDLNPQISNGVNNTCTIITKDNQKKRIWFQQLEENQLQLNRDLLISYHLQGKLSFYRLFRILGIIKTKDVEAFKESLKSYGE